MTDKQPDLEHQRWQFEQNRQIAEKHHDRLSEAALRISEAAVNNANIALRAVLLINGGAAVALLAFIGSLVSTSPNSLVRGIFELTAPLQWFAWGVALATLGMALAYFTNYCVVVQLEEREKCYEHPYIKETNTSTKWGRAAVIFQIFAIVISFTSLGFFIMGMLEVRDAIAGLSG